MTDDNIDIAELCKWLGMYVRDQVFWARQHGLRRHVQDDASQPFDPLTDANDDLRVRDAMEAKFPMDETCGFRISDATRYVYGYQAGDFTRAAWAAKGGGA